MYFYHKCITFTWVYTQPEIPITTFFPTEQSYEKAIVPFSSRHNEGQHNSITHTFPERPPVAEF